MDEQNNELWHLLSEVATDGVWIPALIVRMCDGDMNEAAMLRQTMYWWKKMGCRQFYKSYQSFSQELGLAESVARRAMLRLEQRQLVHLELKKAGGAPTTHIELDEKALQKSILRQSKMDFTPEQNPLQETTTGKSNASFQEAEQKQSTANICVARLAELLKGASPKLTEARKRRYGGEFRDEVEQGTDGAILGEAIERIVERWPDYQLSVEQAIRDVQKRGGRGSVGGNIPSQGNKEEAAARRQEGYEWLFEANYGMSTEELDEKRKEYQRYMEEEGDYPGLESEDR